MLPSVILVGASMVKIQQSYFGVQSLELESPEAEKPVRRSAAAERVARWARASYRLGCAASASWLILAALHTLLSHEQLAYRMLSIIFLGALPALAILLAGHVAFLMLRLASVLNDPIVRRRRRIIRKGRVVLAVVRARAVHPALARAGVGLAWGMAALRWSAGRLMQATRILGVHTAPVRRAAVRIAASPIRLVAHWLLRLQAPALPNGSL